MSNWYLLKADYSQIELRIGCLVAKDARMLAIFNQGEDIHKHTASLVLKIPLLEVNKDHRQKAKAVNFGLIFDQSAAGFQTYAQTEYGVNFTLQECKDFKKAFLDSYPGVRSFQNQVKNDTRHCMFHKKVYVSKGLTGRCRYWRPGDIPLILREGYSGDHEEDHYTVCKDAINYPIQNGNAECMKRSEIIIGREVKKEGLRSKSILQVHDEKVYETHKDDLKRMAQLLYGGMKKGAELVTKGKVPIEIEMSVGRDWANMKEVKVA